jgi:acetyl esterase/lipase
LGSIAALALVMLLVINLTPRPGAWLVRSVFDDGTAKTAAALAKHAPDGVTSITDQQYRAGDDDAYLDVYIPATVDQSGERLPALVWTHGGGWVSGDKTDVVPYFQLIAKEGYAVVAVDYSLAPGKAYPTPLHQVNDALAYLQEHADRLHIDPERIVLAGDSAGAQITSQIAALTTSSAYAAEIGITPALRPEQLRGVILFCGIYDMKVFLEKADHAPVRVLGWGTRTIVWAYTGSRAQDSPTLRQMSTIDHVTADFPPTFISGGNGDPLTDDQSRPLATKLETLGVDVTTLFYPADHQPSLPHEYQFNLDTADGQNALAQTLAFLERHTQPGS